jgi:hypothetical protein
VRSGFLLDLEQGAAIILDHLDYALILRLRNPKLRAWGKDDIFTPAHQHGASSGSCDDELARSKRGASNSWLKFAGAAEPDCTRNLAHAPEGQRG